MTTGWSRQPSRNVCHHRRLPTDHADHADHADSEPENHRGTETQRWPTESKRKGAKAQTGVSCFDRVTWSDPASGRRSHDRRPPGRKPSALNASVPPAGFLPGRCARGTSVPPLATSSNAIVRVPTQLQAMRGEACALRERSSLNRIAGTNAGVRTGDSGPRDTAAVGGRVPAGGTSYLGYLCVSAPLRLCVFFRVRICVICVICGLAESLKQVGPLCSSALPSRRAASRRSRRLRCLPVRG